MISSWRTTTLGVMSILGALSGAVTAILNGQPIDYPTTVAAVMAGLGLIFAKDSNKV